MTSSQMTEILIITLIFCVIALFVAITILIYIKLTKKVKKKDSYVEVNVRKKEEKTKEAIFRSYTRESIYDFMEFEKIEDNMIIQKEGKRFLMIVECQGINYDLMSRVEKVAVEEGFLQFLNSLRHPVQIYVQSRTVNLTRSIENYKMKVNEYKVQLDKMILQYEELKSTPKVRQERLQKYNYEIAKQRNLYEYGKDIIQNTEKMNLNKNVLNKKYYVIIPYYSEEANNEDLDKEEIKNLAFSELYTRAQAVIRTLLVCNVNSKILNSNELVNLLYVAYNRDESEVFDIEKAVELGCEDMYSTAPDVFENKIKVLEEVIAQKAEERAEKAFEETKTRKQIIAENTQDNIEELIDEMAKKILEKNRVYIGEEATEKAKQYIDETKVKKGGVEANENKQKTKRRTSKQ